MKPSDIDANESEAQGSSGPLPLRYLQRYGLAILSVGVALGASLLFQHFHFRADLTARSKDIKITVEILVRHTDLGIGEFDLRHTFINGRCIFQVNLCCRYANDHGSDNDRQAPVEGAQQIDGIFKIAHK